MEPRNLIEGLQNALAPLSSEQLLREKGDLDILALLIPISKGAWQVRMEICCLEIEPGLGSVELYTTLQENLASEDAYSKAIAGWSRDSLGTYGIFRQDDTVSLFHRQMNIIDTNRPTEELVNLTCETVLLILNELDRRVPELKALAQAAE